MKRVAVFARWPEPGRVKTRLSPALPANLACDLYRAMLEDALAAATASGAGERLLYWAEPPGPGQGPANAELFQARLQSGPDLGARLERAFAELLRAAEDRAVVAGADCPDLSAALLRDAFVALERHDLVLGPSRDGGYYLVGLRRAAPELFHGIPWSTDRVLTETLERASRAGHEPALLPALEDLDTPADLVRYLARMASAGGPSGPRSLDSLRAMGLLPG